MGFKNKNFIVLAFLVSILFHVLFLKTEFNFSSNEIKKSEIEKKYTLKEFNLLDNQALQEIKAQQVKSNEKSKQIVNSEDTGEEIKPDKSRFLGEKDQTFKKQQIAKNVDIFNKAGLGQTDGESKKVAEDKAKSQDKEIEQFQKLNKKSKLKIEDLSVEEFAKNFADKTPQSNLAKAQKKLSDVDKLSRLGVNNGDASSVGFSANNDFVEDVPLGNVTNLNTTEFKYFGFYHRIRQKLEQYWGNSLREKAERLYRQGRKIASSSNLITSLKIILDEKGNIVQIEIQGSSGAEELDKAAVESFNKAGPFPNPPRGMMKNGIAEINWGFVVKT